MTRYVWDHAWVPHTEPALDAKHWDEVTCADSWRHRNGTLSGFDAHRGRFEHTAGPLPDALWATALDLLDQPGDFFPRIVLAAGRIYLEIRPAPAPRTTTALTLPQQGWPEPRTAPLVKGPDLQRLARHRAAYCAPGTDDVALDNLAETTTGALVGWCGDTLVVPTATALPSITRSQVVRRAIETGVAIEHGQLSPTHPLWFLNALHGISPVDQVWVNGAEMTVPHHPETEGWVDWWWGTFARPDLV
ncbi:aminotransferase class IV [Corynebacterium sp.]|uniref:aminotransferase class IV n=1 Tax=Corynebacterium sp. TaxID=1720 RepID=UPI002A91BB66|nr:aminotransferase class IV [Corynebacterium sp.]MDY5785496.1 aminotransferase class IV [Corynebacterium sp.]